MATPEQKVASKSIMDAVTQLNKALDKASAERLWVELATSNEIGKRNANYFVHAIETRETVLP